jgi:hypothetical protein
MRISKTNLRQRGAREATKHNQNIKGTLLSQNALIDEIESDEEELIKDDRVSTRGLSLHSRLSTYWSEAKQIMKLGHDTIVMIDPINIDKCHWDNTGSMNFGVGDTNTYCVPTKVWQELDKISWISKAQ